MFVEAADPDNTASVLTPDDNGGNGAHTVTGRTYRRTRPRGFAEWRPQAQTRELLEGVEQVFSDYAEHLPLTARQVFYSLVGRHGYPKTEAAYARLAETLTRARRGGLIDFTSIRDDGGTRRPAPGWDDPREFLAWMRSSAHAYERERAQDQAVAVELWVEAAGMVPQAERVAHNYGADVYSSGGFDSLTVKHDAAQRMADRDVPTVVLHVGDWDPSGCSIVDALAEDVAAFVAGYGGPAPEFRRLAVTPEQVVRYDLETAPQKSGDNRGERMAETVQAEALPPDVLAAEMRVALESVVDLDVLAEVRRVGDLERGALLARLEELAL